MVAKHEEHAGETTKTSKIPDRTRVIIILVALCCLLAGISIGAVLRGVVDANLEDFKLSISKRPLTPDSLSAAFSRVADQVEPSVVYVKVTRGKRGLQEISGSGVIVHTSGYILTNHHVIEDASVITVRLADNREFAAKLIGEDEGTDLAVLKIDVQEKLPTSTMGDSERLKVGDWVLAIGSPFGLEQTVTAGIISAKDRVADSRRQSAYKQFIQTDAAINPGNSGGPLVNLAGEIVGINTELGTTTGFNTGIGLAIPSSTVVDIYNQIITYGRVRRAFLGIRPLDVPEQIARLNKLQDGQGAYVADLLGEDSPALRAGLQSGDVIVSINGQKVRDYRHLIRFIGSLPIGSRANVIYIRNGVEKSAVIVLEERQESNILQMPPSTPRNSDDTDTNRNKPKSKQNLGLSVVTLSREIARTKGIEGMRGVYVTKVDPFSVLSKDIFADDVITEIGGKPVQTSEDFFDELKGFRSGDEVELKVMRKGRGPIRGHLIIPFRMP
jgi:serine protease Do